MAKTTLTKDQVRQLTPEQQEALGDLEVQRLRSHQQLLKRARGGIGATAGLLMGLAGGLAILSTAIPRILPFAIIAVIALVGFLAGRLNRRLDAVIRLLDETEREQKDDDHAT